jgi:ubiquitin C-terminal hydrolase
VVGKWYEFDDSTVSSVDPGSVITKAAYVLFYKKRNI